MADENTNDAMVDEPVGGDEEVGVEQAAEAPAADTEGTKTMEVAGVTLNEAQLPLFIVLVASIVLLIATGAEYDWNFTNAGSYASYAISISSIAMILSFIGLALNKFSEDTYEKVGKQMNILNFVYSFVGACFLTFDKPFEETSNGYFAAWTVVFGCAMANGMTASAFGSTVKGLGSLMGLLVASLVVLVASIAPVRDDVPNKEEAVYALALSCVTFAYIALVMGMDKRGGSMSGMVHFGCMAILACCWIVMACLVTFRGPFTKTGNGYFGSWAGAAMSSVAAFAAKQAM